MKSASETMRVRKLRRTRARVAARNTLLFLSLLGAAAAGADPSPRLDVEGMTFVASRENGDAIILHAEHARFDTLAKKAYLREVDASVPAATGERSFAMRCDTGVVDLVSNDFEATGNVSGETDSDESFEAEWVRYDHEKGILYTDAPVVISDRGTTIAGGGFNYDIALRRFQLLGGARVIQDINGRETTDRKQRRGTQP